MPSTIEITQAHQHYRPGIQGELYTIVSEVTLDLIMEFPDRVGGVMLCLAATVRNIRHA